MGKALILAEKPDAAKKMAAAFKYKSHDGYFEIEKCDTFKEGAYVIFAIGHLCELMFPESYDKKWKIWNLNTLPIIPDPFKYQVSKGKEKAFNNIKKLANQSDVTELILACDAGREGELIGITIFKMIGVYGKKPLKRLWVSSMTPDAFRNGFANLRDGEETVPYYYESYARSVSDFLVGINLSRAITLHLRNAGIQSDKPFSIGRVQTPVLKIIVDRDREIEKFVSKPFWTIQATFNMDGKRYEGKWYRREKEERITNFEVKAQAEELVNRLGNQPAKIIDVIKERKSVQPPKLHSLSTLQTLAGQKFKYSPTQTLEIAQKLYTTGYISYPRTDSNAITKEEAKQFSLIFGKLKGIEAYSSLLPAPIQSENLSSRFINPKAVSDHYAIIPTEQVPNLSKLSKDELNIYDIIVRSVIAAHYENAEFDHTSIETVIQNETFSTKGKVLIVEGWRKVMYPNGASDSTEEKDNDEDDGLLPPVSKGEEGIAERVEMKEGKTSPKPRLSAANLINVMKYPEKFMETGGVTEDDLEGEIKSMAIGTEATRAGIIDTLVARGFIEIKKSKVFATDKGKLLIDALGNSTVLTSPVMTAKWESVLEQIAKNKVDYNHFIEQSKNLVIKSLDTFSEIAKTWDFKGNPAAQGKTREVLGNCPLCNKEVVDTGKFYACSGYFENKQCLFILGHLVAGKKISAAQVKKIIKNGETDELDGFVSAKKVKFKAKLAVNKELGKIEFKFKPRAEVKEIGVKCPFCQSEILDRGTFLGCQGFKELDCKYTIPRTFLGKELSEQHIQDLLQKGETELIQGFKGKYGAFNGTLYVCKEEKRIKIKVVK